jgi:hypothetical protein
MDKRQRAWLWASAIVSMVVGLILVWNDSGAGWFLIIMGITYLGASTRPGQAWSATNPRLSRWGLIGMTVLLVFLVGVVIAVFLR